MLFAHLNKMKTVLSKFQPYHLQIIFILVFFSSLTLPPPPMQVTRIFGKVYYLATLESLSLTGKILPCSVRLDRTRACYISSGKLHIMPCTLQADFEHVDAASIILSGSWHEDMEPASNPPLSPLYQDWPFHTHHDHTKARPLKAVL